MRKVSQLLLVAAISALALSGCKGEQGNQSNDEVSPFTIYPGSRYLAQLTDVTKQGFKVMHPSDQPPPMAIYDTDAPIDKVAEFYAKAYGYGSVAADATNNLSSAKPPAYYRSGDLAVDVKGIATILPKLNLKTDTSKAAGTYRAAEIDPRPNRARITVQRPYFDVTTSQVVDRTIIVMSR